METEFSHQPVIKQQLDLLEQAAKDYADRTLEELEAAGEPVVSESEVLIL